MTKPAAIPTTEQSDRGSPEGWAIARMADVVLPVPNTKPEDEPARVFGYVDISAVDNSSYQIVEPKQFKGGAAPSRARRPIQPGDVLFSNVRTYLRNIALVPEGLPVHLCSTGFTVLRPGPAIDDRFLFRYVLTDDFIDRVTPQQTGTHYPATSDTVVLAESIPLPPLAEQKRIVAKVEELLAHVNAARERLARVPAILRRFRQAVLADACSGRLTEDWRDSNTCSERGPDLLARIRYERTCSPDRIARPRRADGRIDESSAPWQLPEDWTSAVVSELLHYTRAAGYGVLQPGQGVGSGVPMVRVCDIERGTVLTDRLKRISPAIDAKYKRTRLLGGEVLVTLVGTIGRSAVVPAEAAGANVARAVAVLPLCPHLVPRFVQMALSEPARSAELFDLAREVARKTLNLGLLKSIRLPLPPLAEQHEIVRRVEALFKLADITETRVAAATQRAERLTEAILAKAFRGELVPTEAELARQEGRDYEPASALLEKIRTERVGTGQGPRKAAGRRGSPSASRTE